MKHVHLIGIAGKTMAPLAKMFKEMGWQVTGSDHGQTYPPISTYLKENEIVYHHSYSAKNIVGKPDLVVVGRSALLVDPQNPEYWQAEKLGLRIVSYPEVLRDYLVKTNSIVIAGTYGKTTISGLTAWILEKAGFNPSFMIGGVPLNFADGIRKTNSAWSVVEGDEPPAMKETDPPKFMFYKPKYLLLTACQWDHPEIFRTAKEYKEAFIKLVKLVPQDGLVIACLDGKDVDGVVKKAKCPVIWYSCLSNEVGPHTRSDLYWVDEIQFTKDKMRFTVVWRDNKTKKKGKRLTVYSPLLGLHNVQNVCGVVALTLSLGIKPEVIKKAVRNFRGIRTRLELVGEFGGVRVFWDFAQHPLKVKETLSALRTRYKENKIICVFDPHQSMLQGRESLAWYPDCFDQASGVIVTKVSFSKSIPKKERVTGKDIVEAIKQTQPSVNYQPIDRKIVTYLTRNARKDNVIIFMSSGGQRTPWIIQKLLKN